MSRIQRKNREAILEAALEIFSRYGFRGATLDQIASSAGLSKPNLLYYFPSKEEIHRTLLLSLLDRWLEPLQGLDASGDPFQEVLNYMMRRLDMTRDSPRECRLFANEMLGSAPYIREVLDDAVRDVVVEKSAILRGWMEAGLIASCDPVHLIFSIWALTQQYADEGVQLKSIMGQDYAPHEDAAVFLEQLLRRLLRPRPLW